MAKKKAKKKGKGSHKRKVAAWKAKSRPRPAKKARKQSRPARPKSSFARLGPIGRSQFGKVKARPKSKAKPSTAKQHKPKKAKSEYDSTGLYEETTVVCPGCGRETKMIKIAGLDTEGMLCQRCAKGEVELGDMDF